MNISQNRNLSQNLSKTLYVELILDGYRAESLEGLMSLFPYTINLTLDHSIGVRNLLRVFEWTIEGTMSETEFSNVFQGWIKKQVSQF
jgi:hypothetical protein